LYLTLPKLHGSTLEARFRNHDASILHALREHTNCCQQEWTSCNDVPAAPAMQESERVALYTVA
jgi:hypothetical protein